MKKQTESTLTVLLVEPEKKPRVVTIPHTLKEMQNLVGGLIECTQPFTDSEVALISNEEGKLLGLPLNRAIFWKDSTEPYDIIAGTFCAMMIWWVSERDAPVDCVCRTRECWRSWRCFSSM